MKIRLDNLVMEQRGFSRSYAADVIRRGLVLVGGVPETKPGKGVCALDVCVLASDMPFVSRGGVKLASALDKFDICVAGLVCLDIGASTGGFTDCLLKRGAAQVVAVDTGRGQMAGSLRNDERVVLHEGCDIRGFDHLHPGTPVDFAVCDVSFISQTKVIPFLPALIKGGGGFVSLIKPQFETDRQNLSKNHIVRSQKAREAAVLRVRTALAEAGFTERGFMESPISGRDGNVEFLVYAVLQG